MIEYPLLELQFHASPKSAPYQFLSCSQTKNKTADENKQFLSIAQRYSIFSKLAKHTMACVHCSKASSRESPQAWSLIKVKNIQLREKRKKWKNKSYWTSAVWSKSGKNKDYISIHISVHKTKYKWININEFYLHSYFSTGICFSSSVRSVISTKKGR